MSLHIAVSGITSFQRALKMTMKGGLTPLPADKREELMIAGALEWNDISSLNNLKDVYKVRSLCINNTCTYNLSQLNSLV
jgi:hypothetical protein